MNVRNLVGKTVDELKDLGACINGLQCRNIEYKQLGKEYWLHFGNGSILIAKGHESFNRLFFPRQSKSIDRIPESMKW